MVFGNNKGIINETPENPEQLKRTRKELDRLLDEVTSEMENNEGVTMGMENSGENQENFQQENNNDNSEEENEVENLETDEDREKKDKTIEDQESEVEYVNGDHN